MKKAEDLRTFRGSSSFSGKTHALDQTFQGVRDSHLEMGKKQITWKKSLNFYSFYSLYHSIPIGYLIILYSINLNGLVFCHRRSFVLGRWKKLSLRAACNGGAHPGSV